jgi:hypothetical protein
LGIDRIEGSPFPFQGGNRSDLVVQGQTGTIPFLGVSSMLQKMIVKPSALFQLPGQESLLFGCRIQPILECAPHVVHAYTNSTILKALKEHALYLRDESRSFTAFPDKRGP